MSGLCRVRAALALLVSAAPATAVATDLVPFGAEDPRVGFDVPLTVVAEAQSATPATLAPGEQLVTVEIPVSVVVARGDVDRVGEVSIEVDGSAAGLRVYTFQPMTRLESEFASDIEVETSSDTDRRLDASLGGLIPSPGGAVAQLAPTITAGRASRAGETEKSTRLAPKEAVVVAGATNRRQGVLFKFRPSSQTTLEGERRLSVTFVAPPDFRDGELTVRCAASGQRRVLFVRQRRIWGSAAEPVTVRLADASPASRTVAKPVLEGPVAEGS